ncbi:hypothetical protein [Streptomyces sp. NPDC000410]|uniref:hypothetical protein n=1 Tax=Streptomyces sp. NPDC000410 TaxID=3154254 RepID=UPI0033338DCC
MHGRELARAAIRLLTEGGPTTQEEAARQAKVRVLVEDRLSRGKLGAAALERLRDEPGEAAASIAAEVLADEITRDTAFAALLTDVVGADAGTVPPVAPPPAPPKPPLPPTAGTPQPWTATSARGPRLPLPDIYRRRTWVIWLLGLPQALVTYVLLSVLIQTSDGGGGIVGVLYVLLILIMAAGLATSVALAVELLRRFTSPTLLTAVIIHSLLLLRIVVGAR